MFKSTSLPSGPSLNAPGGFPRRRISPLYNILVYTEHYCRKYVINVGNQRPVLVTALAWCDSPGSAARRSPVPPRAEDSGERPRVPEVADTSLFLLNESLLPERTGVTTPLSRLSETREPLRDIMIIFGPGVRDHSTSTFEDNSRIVTVKDDTVVTIDCVILSII